MELIWSDPRGGDTQRSDQPDACAFKLAVALGRGCCKVKGRTHYLWRAVDHKRGVLESFVTNCRGRKLALKFLRKAMKRYGNPDVIVTGRLKPYGIAMRIIGNVGRQVSGR